jgi:hypothetical protein
MADNFGGGFEQNGFPASNVPETVRSGQCNDYTAQFPRAVPPHRLTTTRSGMKAHNATRTPDEERR